MLEISGEEFSGGTRCPGDGLCDIWDAAAGDFEQKSLVCGDCKTCQGKPPLAKGEEPSAPDADLIDETERLVGLADCGIKIEWENKPFELFLLFQHWRTYEKQIEAKRQFELRRWQIERL